MNSTAFSRYSTLNCYVDVSADQMAVIRSKRLGFADCHRCVLLMGRSVPVSLPVTLLLSPHRPCQPLAKTIGFCMVANPAPLAWGLGLSHEIFSPFHLHFPPKKPNFQPLQLAALPGWSHFEHCSIKMGILDIERLHLTLCLCITYTHSTSKFCLKTSQYSI